ncbi:MAG: hypothetical protein HC876_21055 [Chloroflexaceae bacterium]|nr:hypothetical protein [Chloroflexaceae bacterium]
MIGLGVTAGTGGSGAGAAVLGLMIMLVLLVGVVFVIVMSLFVFAVFLFSTQVIVIEGYGPIGALRRSWNLVTGSFWRVVGILVVTWLLVGVLQWLPAYVVQLVLQILFSAPEEFFMLQSFSTIANYVILIVFLPIQMTALTLLYYDVRVRKEGLDLELKVHSDNLATEAL